MAKRQPEASLNTSISMIERDFFLDERVSDVNISIFLFPGVEASASKENPIRLLPRCRSSQRQSRRRQVSSPQFCATFFLIKEFLNVNIPIFKSDPMNLFSITKVTKQSMAIGNTSNRKPFMT